MSALTLAVACLALALALAATYGGWMQRRQRDRGRLLTVHTVGGETFAGVLVERRRSELVLRDAAQRNRQLPDPLPVDGEVVIRQERVEWVQVLPRAAA